jgi:hypothetical protein
MNIVRFLRNQQASGRRQTAQVVCGGTSEGLVMRMAMRNVETPRACPEESGQARRRGFEVASRNGKTEPLSSPRPPKPQAAENFAGARKQVRGRESGVRSRNQGQSRGSFCPRDTELGPRSGVRSRKWETWTEPRRPAGHSPPPRGAHVSPSLSAEENAMMKSPHASEAPLTRQPIIMIRAAHTPPHRYPQLGSGR